MRIRLAGQGAEGNAGGPRCDRYMLVQVRPHPRFWLEGDDPRTRGAARRSIAPLGGEVAVPTLKGQAKLKIPAGHG